MSDAAIHFADVGKMYKVFDSRSDNLLDALGMSRFLVGRRARYREFWALRGIDFTVGRGERVGIIGRNGAGKSTLLKLVTGNLPATEGEVTVRGDVQALLEIGGGLHPEFTGHENINAALGFMGLNRDQIEEATRDIADFTELGRFLEQPFKTYSLGMQARLSLGIATSIQPEILIIDEILGTGDAYFFTKSTARMKRLLDGGASVLLVSHALDQVARFCERTVWIDRGRIVMEGRTVEVVKAYERFTRDLEDARLRAKNEKARLGYDSFDRDSYTESLRARVTVSSGACDVAELALLADDSLEGRVDVGHAQDADVGQNAYIDLGTSDWSAPVADRDAHYRRVLAGPAPTTADALFHLWFYYPQKDYVARVRYRQDGGEATFEVFRNGVPYGRLPLPSTDGEWQERLLPLERGSATTQGPAFDRSEAAGDRVDEPGLRVSHWSGLGKLHVDQVRLEGPHGATTLLTVGAEAAVTFSFHADEAGTYDVIPIALIFREDGIVVTRHIAEKTTLDLGTGDRAEARLDLSPLLLGNGTYILTVGLYRTLDPHDAETAEYYDVLDRSYEFRVTGNPALHNELLVYPSRWSLERLPAEARTSTAVAAQAGGRG
jgi:lipopolysaccharide transport system ATP-binding protein